MPRNTYIVVLLLAIFAALVVGVNIGRSLIGTTQPQSASTQTAVSPTATPTPKKPELIAYANDRCGITLGYPKTVKPMEAADGNTIFINAEKPDQSVILLCQRSIPTPKGIPFDEKIDIGSASATIYEEGSPSSQTVLTYHMQFTHPGKRLSILVSGIGDAYEQIIRSIKLR